MNKLQKNIINSFNQWYKTCKVYSKALHSKNVTIEVIEETSKVITDELNKITIEGSDEIVQLHIKIVESIILICKKQAKVYKNDRIPLKVFRSNIDTIISSFKNYKS